jgi:hypothetical protein
VLFVIDNSGAMDEAQASLLLAFPAFLDVLADQPGGLPNLHIGVVSSNVGAGGFDITGCGGEGDDGRLQNTSNGACSGPNGFYISDRLSANGVTRIKNYNGTLEETFSCIALLGTDGCGFEGHLEAMRRAFAVAETPQNQGFLRGDAALLVIIVANEDDCSASNPAFYDPMLTAELGELTSFRCTEFGVECAEGLISRDAASYTACVPRSESPYMHHSQVYADDVRALKNDPGRIGVGLIVAPPEPVVVTVDGGGFSQLEPSCGAAAGSAYPAVRLTTFAEQFETHATATICQNDFTAALVQIAGLAAPIMAKQ